jgi:hypothetical protein
MRTVCGGGNGSGIERSLDSCIDGIARKLSLETLVVSRGQQVE